MNLDIRLSILFFLLFIFSPLPSVYAVEKYEEPTDSLRRAIKITSGEEKLALILVLAEQIRTENRDEAIRLVEDVLAEAQQTSKKSIELQANYFLGKIYSGFNKNELSEMYLNRALEIAEEWEDTWYKGEILYRKGVNKHNIGEDILALELFNSTLKFCRLSNNYKTIGATYSMMGTVYRINGLYDRAIEYIIKSKLNYEKANYAEGNAWTAYLLGRIYADLNVPQKSYDYFLEALEIYQKMAALDGNQNGVAICKEQIGLLNMELGNLQEAQKDIEYVLEIHRVNKSEYGISTAYKHLGMIEYSMNNYKQAEDYLKLSLKMKADINDKRSQPTLYLYIGLSYIGLKKTDEGFENILKGLDLAILNNQKNIQLDIYSKLSEAYLNMNDLENANYYQNKQIEVQHFLLTGIASVKMEQLQAIYEIDEKNTQIAELEAQNEIATLRIRQQKTYQVVMVFGIVLVLFVAIFIFIFYTQIRRKNNQLNKANATKDRLFSIIAHDLRGPVGSMLGLSQIFVEEIEKGNLSLVEKHASMLHKSLNHTFGLLNNLLEWARSQLHGSEFNPCNLMLHKTVADIMELLSFRMDEKQLNFEIKVDDKLQVNADEVMLKSILRNLISNAIKFSNTGGRIVVSAALNKGRIEVCVQDNGVGMTPAQQNGLFSLETNTSTVGTSGEKGTGLGLVLAKEFVEKHNGKIGVKTKTGQGSIFCFSLPAV